MKGWGIVLLLWAGAVQGDEPAPRAGVWTKAIRVDAKGFEPLITQRTGEELSDAPLLDLRDIFQEFERPERADDWGKFHPGMEMVYRRATSQLIVSGTRGEHQAFRDMMRHTLRGLDFNTRIDGQVLTFPREGFTRLDAGTLMRVAHAKKAVSSIPFSATSSSGATSQQSSADFSIELTPTIGEDNGHVSVGWKLMLDAHGLEVAGEGAMYFDRPTTLGVFERGEEVVVVIVTAQLVALDGRVVPPVLNSSGTGGR